MRREPFVNAIHWLDVPFVPASLTAELALLVLAVALVGYSVHRLWGAPTLIRKIRRWLFPPDLPGKCRLCREDPIYQDGLCKGCFKGSVW